MRLTPIIAAAALLAAVPAAATHYIVDTGAGTDFQHAPYLYNFGNNQFEFVAIQFFVPTATTIHSIEGAFAARVADSTLTVRLYNVGDATDAPAGPAFFAKAFSVPDNIGFHGVSNIAVPIARGYYYAAFEVDDGQTFNGFALAGAPNPQAKEAGAYNVSNGYLRIIDTNKLVNDLGSLGLGLRIADTPAGAVPEPAMWAMLVAGFGLVGGAVRRRREMAVVSA